MNGNDVSCRQCRTNYSVSAEEMKFLEKVAPTFDQQPLALPCPRLCPGCREQQRLAFRNEWNLYRRKCAATNKDIIAIYHTASPYVVYDSAVWWSDQYDPLQYGRAFDFSRPFFEQFHELNLAVPKAAIQNAKSENSAYTNYSNENKNCYMCSGCAGNEDCYYCSRVLYSKNVCDAYDVVKSESCYECTQCSSLYSCVYSRNCRDSSFLIWCENCRGCRECFGCSNLTQESFCLFNEKLTESEYRAAIRTLKGNMGAPELSSRKPKSDRDTYNINCDDCAGEQLLNCSRCSSCFTLKESQDCRYCGCGQENVDCYDANYFDKNELLYFCTNQSNNYHVLFSALVWYSNQVFHSMNSFHSNNLFGCSGMKRNAYCILNQQYDQRNYGATVRRIAEHMKETGEWGSFFPASISPFPYNSSVSQEYYPLSKEEALSRGLSWYEPENDIERKAESTPSAAPAGVQVCAVTGKQFKISKQERELCEKLGINPPLTCPEERRRERMKDVRPAIRHYV